MNKGKPAVLFLHGAGGGAWEWRIWRRVFAAEGFESTALDLQPAAGGLTETRFGDYAGQVRAAVELKPAPRVLIGASLGGLLALAAADLAEALVLVNPMPPAPWHSMMPVREPWPVIIPWGAGSSLAGTRRAMPDADDAACLFAFRRWRDESGAVMNEAQAGLAIETPACPCLLLASGCDQDVPTVVSVELAQRLSADLVCLPSASHVGSLLGRDAVAAALQSVAWLNALPEAC